MYRDNDVLELSVLELASLTVLIWSPDGTSSFPPFGHFMKAWKLPCYIPQQMKSKKVWEAQSVGAYG